MGASLGVILMVTLILSPPSVASKPPIYASPPPFSASSLATGNSSGSTGCGGFAQVSHPAKINPSTGRFSMAINASAHSVAGCTSYSVNSYADAGFAFTSQNLTFNVSGNHVLRTYWWLNFAAKLSASSSSAYAYGDAQLGLQIYVTLIDLTPIGFGTGASATFGPGLVSTTNGSTSLSMNTSISLPIAVTLTRSHVYQVVVEFYVDVNCVADLSYPGDTASANIEVGTAGHGSFFRGFTVR